VGKLTKGKAHHDDKVTVSFMLQVAKKANCDCAIVLSSNDFTRRIFVKLGMETLKKTSWCQCHKTFLFNEEFKGAPLK